MEKINIKVSYLDELISQEYRKLVGKIMKRFDVESNKNESLKKHVKEVIYEHGRDFRGLLIAHHYGHDRDYFDYSQGQPTESKQDDVSL